MQYRMTIDDVPELAGYLTVAQVVEKYGVNKQTVYYWIFNQMAFRSVCKVTKGGDSKRPVLLLATSEVEKVLAKRAEVQNKPPDYKELLRRWNKRVKDWARNEGWTQTLISVTGPPNRLMVEAYMKEHPDDPRPE